MKTYRLSEKLTVASQPDIGDFAGMKAEGYTLVINNRPDFEEATQPTSAAEAQAAEEAGIAYVHLPVGAAPLTEATVRGFQQAVTQASGPVLAHCRSATRSANLWAIGEVLEGRMVIADLGALSQSLGLDLRTAQAWLSQR